MKLTIQGSFTDLNTYIGKERTNKFIGAKIKKENTENVMWQIKGKKLPDNILYPIDIDFIWHIKNKKKDLDNIVFAKKFILDGLVNAGFIIGDGLNQIKSFSDNFIIDQNECVEIFISNKDMI